MEWEAEEYADELYRVMQHHTNLHYPTDIVSEYKYTGKHTYCQARKGLWTRHFPTWKCYLALAALRDAAEAMPLQLEFKDEHRPVVVDAFCAACLKAIGNSLLGKEVQS